MKRFFMLSSMIVVLCGCGTQARLSPDTKIIAHRGGALIGNENTLSCFEKGISAGADMIELDIHLSADGELIVCHDPSIDRTTDGKGMIEKLTLAQIKEAHIKDFQTGEISDERIPTLSEVFDMLGKRCKVLLEIKRNRKDQYPGIEAKTLELINSYGLHDEVVIQSFDDEVIERTHEIDPDMRVEKLIVCRLPFGLCFDGKIKRFSFEKYSYASSINSFGKLTSGRFVRDCHKHGKEVKIWTVNKLSGIVPEVDGIITNRPDIFIEAKRNSPR